MNHVGHVWEGVTPGVDFSVNGVAVPCPRCLGLKK